jgi:hypothetical protein
MFKTSNPATLRIVVAGVQRLMKLMYFYSLQQRHVRAKSHVSRKVIAVNEPKSSEETAELPGFVPLVT